MSQKNLQVKNYANYRFIHLTPIRKSCTDDSDVLAEMLVSNCEWNNLEKCCNGNKTVSREEQSKDKPCQTDFSRDKALSKNQGETFHKQERGNNKREETDKWEEPSKKEYNNICTETQVVSSSSSSRLLVLVKLHNLPRNWLYEEIIEFINQVAEHAGIEPPVLEVSHHSVEHGNNDAEVEMNNQIKSLNSSSQVNETSNQDDGSALPQTQSPFIHHIFLPFGRRTGLVYGDPVLLLTSMALANYLVNDLNFSDDDYRQRIYFTKEANEKIANGTRPHFSYSGSSVTQPRLTSFVPIEETLEAEKAEALRTLELDRYLLSPDLLWEIPRRHQKKLLTRNEKILVDTLLSTDNNEESADMEHASDPYDQETSIDDLGKTKNYSNNDDDNDDVGDKSRYNADAFMKNTESFPNNLPNHNNKTEIKTNKKVKVSNRKRASMLRRKRKISRLAGEQTDIGRGSFINMPIGKPYVRHRIM